ncbi:aminotransferase class V-fold PLP-dependent enzyme [Streptomyces sp. NBC_00237]|uniref:aminotransferase class V-fold PLP-dependent enzyme n=1 Tax=Streptomyces sp. NBC_00237 TaxID=2975687 RepID=UPI00225B0BDC|nr:aminotransferase class V-fold PLP-dependent enzyme [Streptomyces sp. NBC_00237]MCX5206807.1 aminotransferase class V-fold PLP-dependent enzyme [Streptomyces sp. NBC_00237]
MSAPAGAAAFRARFPALDRRTHLASCSLGARSTDLDEAMVRMLDDMAEGDAPWALFEEQVGRARTEFAALIGARVDQVAVVPNASVGAYQVASALDWSTRPTVVSTTLEFPSVAHVWLAQRPRGAEVRHAEQAEDYAELIDERTRLVSVPLTGYQDAARLPVAEVARLAHDAGARVFVDAYQAVGVEPVDVDRLGCDFLVAGTMKYLLGLPGLAFLYVREPQRDLSEPQLTGWFGRVDPFAFDPKRLDFAPTAARFETGTPAVPACYAAVAGLRLIRGLDLLAVREHVLDLTDLAISQLADRGLPVRTLPRERRGAHIGLVDADPSALGRRLADRGIAVSPRGDVVRLSFHYYNSTSDVAALCAALDECRGTRGLSPHRSGHWSNGRSHAPTS